MQLLAASVLDDLKRGTLGARSFARVGAADPAKAASAFQLASRDAALEASAAVWVPALLRSARPGFGAHCLLELSESVRARGGVLRVAEAPMLPLLLGSSNALARRLLRHPEWVDVLAGDLPPAPHSVDPEPSWDAIRAAKYRGLLAIAARDLAGRPFDASLRELSDLADGCLRAGLACAAREADAPEPALLALGKLGGRELNFSSDVDVLFLSDAPDGVDVHDHQQAMERLIRRFKRGLEEPTEDGFAYRVDLDLRPEGRSGILSNPVDAALTYYEGFGAEWERQMLIRLRALAGPPDTLKAFTDAITPFVYRRAIDPGVMRAVADMKHRIEDERRRAGRDLEIELKEGPGGIRDVEFLVQSFQLFHGGGHPELRTGNVLDSLHALGRLALLPEPITAALAAAYTWLRRAEHAVQLAEEQQTNRFPRDAPGQIALARRMGYAEPDAADARTALLEDWTQVRNEVRGHFQALVLGEAS